MSPCSLALFDLMLFNLAIFCSQDWYTSAEKEVRDDTVRFVWTATNQELPLNSQMWGPNSRHIDLESRLNLVVYSFDYGKI